MRTATSNAISILPYAAFGEAYEDFHLSNPDKAYSSSFPQNHFEGNVMHNSLGTVPSINRGEQSSYERTATPDVADWLRDFFREIPAKVIANDAGINLRAAENVKQGRNGLLMAHLENLCRSNPEFRAAWFIRCGGHLETNPNQVAALYRAMNGIMRGDMSE